MKNLVLGLISSFYATFTRLVFGIKKIECSVVMYMDGRVKSAVFIPSYLEMQPVPLSSCPGLDAFNDDRHLYLYEKIPNQYETIFTSERGSIKLLTKDAFDRFKNREGELVTISYYEIYHTVYDKRTNELIKCIESDYKILGINLK